MLGQIQRINQKLLELGATWTGSGPYHVEVGNNHIRHFSSLDKVEAYLDVKIEVRKTWNDFKSGKISYEEYERHCQNLFLEI